jgi:hypothetical protein
MGIYQTLIPKKKNFFCKNNSYPEYSTSINKNSFKQFKSKIVSNFLTFPSPGKLTSNLLKWGRGGWGGMQATSTALNHRALQQTGFCQKTMFMLRVYLYLITRPEA